MNCPVCHSQTKKYFQTQFLRLTKQLVNQIDFLVEYNKCPNCEVIFCSTIFSMSVGEISSKIYNQNYVKIDNTWISNKNNRIQELNNIIKTRYRDFKDKLILDYGCGGGFSINMLNSEGWNGINYDPYVQQFSELPSNKFDLIVSFEVFEHLFNFQKTIENIISLSKAGTKIFISTQFYPSRNINTWWYLNPRCGHIIFYNLKTFQTIAELYGFRLNNISNSQHELIKI